MSRLEPAPATFPTCKVTILIEPLDGSPAALIEIDRMIMPQLDVELDETEIYADERVITVTQTVESLTFTGKPLADKRTGEWFRTRRVDVVDIV